MTHAAADQPNSPQGDHMTTRPESITVTREQLVNLLAGAIWELSHSNQWPILGDDFPAAERMVETIFHDAQPCEITADRWCATHSTADFRSYCK